MKNVWSSSWPCKLVFDEKCLVKFLTNSESCLSMCGRIAHWIQRRNKLIHFQRPVKNNRKECLYMRVPGRDSESVETGELL